jgi:hypothetical protein
MSLARNLARLFPNASGLLPNANIEAMAASKLTGQVPDANAPSGSVIQVVQGYNSGVYSTTGQTKTSLVTSPSITPRSANSKIFVCITTMASRGGANSSAFFEVRRGSSTSLLQSGQVCHFSHWNDYSTATQNNTAWQYLDSPNTTGAVSYQVFGWSDGGSTSARLGGRGSEGEHNCGVNWILIEVSE